jgi:peptide deformylase
MKYDNTYLFRYIPTIVELPLNKKLANDMMSFMRRHKGLGLAANQVGIPYRLFVMDVNAPRRCFNPKINYSANIENTKEIEGCLSYPGIFQLKPRATWIEAEYTDQNGKQVIVNLFGLEAICYQHELDHLNGVEWNKTGLRQ